MTTEKRTAERQRREEDRKWWRPRARIKCPGLVFGVVAGVLLWLLVLGLAGALESINPWSNRAALQAAKDSLAAVEATRDSVLAAQEAGQAERDSLRAEINAANDANQALQERADRLGSTNRTQKAVIARLQAEAPDSTPEGRIVQLEGIVDAQAGLIVTLESEKTTLQQHLDSQRANAGRLEALVASLEDDLADSRTETERYRQIALEFDQATGCGFPGNILGCPSSTAVFVATTLVVVPLTLLTERLLVDHGNPTPVVIVNDGYLR